MSKKNRKKTDFYGDNFWQSAAYNQRIFFKYLNWIFSLAVNRFKWEGLPDTCNPRLLEYTLLRDGIATIAKDELGVWFNLIVGGIHDWNVYKEPVAWDVFGYNATKLFSANTESGVIIYENKNKFVPYSTFELFARELTQCERTLQVNRAQQHVPVVITGKREQKQELYNFGKQIVGFETLVLADESFTDDVKVETFKLDTPFLANDLWADRRNIWNEVYTFLGIKHLAFEKKERMIEQETESNDTPAGIMAMNELQAREEACEKLNKITGWNVTCEWNKDSTMYAVNEDLIELMNNTEGGADNESNE